jgi:hypothetical protein
LAKSTTDSRGSFRDYPQFLTIRETSKILDTGKQVEEKLEEKKTTRQKVPKDSNKMPDDSIFYDKLVPILLITLGVIMVLLILIAAGILLGFF